MSVPQGVTGEVPWPVADPARQSGGSSRGAEASPSGDAAESPTVIRDRAVSVTDYLLAVRAQMERPARTVPAADAH
jgi:hypothetical protein